MYFWRTSIGNEVDILVEDQGKIIPIEVKASSTPKPLMADGIISLRKDLSKKISDGYLIHLGDPTLPLGGNVKAMPFSQL